MNYDTKKRFEACVPPSPEEKILKDPQDQIEFIFKLNKKESSELSKDSLKETSKKGYSRMRNYVCEIFSMPLNVMASFHKVIRHCYKLVNREIIL